MYPVLFRLGHFEITSFGVLVALGALIGWRVFRSELRAAGLPGSASDLIPFAILAGFAGAKLVWAVEPLSVYEQSFPDLVFSRGGFSWFGGLIGGVGTGIALVMSRPCAQQYTHPATHWRMLPV